MMSEQLITGIMATLFAALLTFTTTPIASVIAHKIGAIDIPKDERRMHKVPIPRLGGLAIFFGFTVASAVFCDFSPELLALWIGGTVIVILGTLDDVFRLKAWIKFLAQIAVACIAVSQGVIIEWITIGGNYISLNHFAIPITILWIVAIINAINLIDGLDGLSCGVSAICSLTLLTVTILASDIASTMFTAILFGACIGFLPFNHNPAKIFMGDTGAMFLGYILAVISIEGVFKLHTIISFLLPISIFALPLFDTLFAIIRRICHGKSPFSADRGHLHHRLIDMGFDQKQAVYILYSICGILGVSSVLSMQENLFKVGIVVFVGLLIFIVNFLILKNPHTKTASGLHFTKISERKQNPPVTTVNAEEKIANLPSTETEEMLPDAAPASSEQDEIKNV